MSLVASNDLWVEANPKETDLTYLKVGDEAEVSVDAYPGKTWKAKVTSLSPATGAEFSVLPPQNATGNWVKVVQRVPVKLAIENAAGAPKLTSGMLPVIYGIKQIAKYGHSPDAIGALIVGVLFAILFVRRQRRLPDPLLDMTLFSSRAFSVALIVLLVGLIAVGGTMLLVAQYLQLVAGYSPFAAGLWMGLAALATIAGGLGAPLIARHGPILRDSGRQIQNKNACRPGQSS